MTRFRDALFLALCGTLLVFYGVTQRPLTRSSEGRVARVAQEILDDGDWIVPHLNGNVRLEKPPFSSWLVALTTKWTTAPNANGTIDVKPWHAYVPPGIATVLLLLLVYGWMAKSEPKSWTTASSGAPASPGWSLFAPLVLATANGFFNQARSAEMDMLLALFVTLAMCGFWESRVSGCRVALLIAYAALGLSILTKGHVGLVIAVPSLLIWQFVERSHAALPLPARGRAIWHALGVALILITVLPWGIAFLQQSGLTWEAFKKEGLSGRFGSDVPHYEVPWWYLIQIPSWFLPWTILFVIGLAYTWDLPPDERSPLRRLCWIWLVWSTLLFSCISSKQRHYAIPFFPPLAMLIADTTARWFYHPNAGHAKIARTTLAILGGLLAAAALASVPLAGKIAADQKTMLWLVAAVAAAVFAVSIPKIMSCGCASYLWWAGSICLVVIFSQTVEVRDALNSPEPFCVKVRNSVPPGEDLYDFDVALPRREGATGKPVWRAQVLFYLRRKVTETETALTDLLKEKKGAYVIATQKNMDGVAPELYTVIAKDDKFLGHKNDVFLIQSRRE
jgi:4-amino-4-deoxy-L-arabinose transferase-like glycosyltransferase